MQAALEERTAEVPDVAAAKPAVSSATADTSAADAVTLLRPAAIPAAKCSSPVPCHHATQATAGQSRPSSACQAHPKSSGRHRAGPAADSDSSSGAVSDSETLMKQTKQSGIKAWRCELEQCVLGACLELFRSARLGVNRPSHYPNTIYHHAAVSDSAKGRYFAALQVSQLLESAASLILAQLLQRAAYS